MRAQQDCIFGIHAVREALEAGRDVDKVLIRRGISSDPLKQLLGELRRREVPVQQVPIEKLQRITRKNHQGVIAWLSQISYTRLESLIPIIYEQGEDPFLVMLDGVSDVRNFGAIARTAECAGVHGLVIPAQGSAAVNADAVKTSAGALHSLPVCRQRDLASAVRFLRESGLKIVAATEKASDPLYEANLTGPVCLVMGSEETGISPAILKDADQRVSIPMKGKISSLNVSVAAGVLIYETIRQKGGTQVKSG
jgi:23S rRNA (guanosine2251-2'-O)-methyltransferase